MILEFTLWFIFALWCSFGALAGINWTIDITDTIEQCTNQWSKKQRFFAVFLFGPIYWNLCAICRILLVFFDSLYLILNGIEIVLKMIFSTVWEKLK